MEESGIGPSLIWEASGRTFLPPAPPPNLAARLRAGKSVEDAAMRMLLLTVAAATSLAATTPTLWRDIGLRPYPKLDLRRRRN